MNPATVTADQLKALLRDGTELALIDVREQGVFYRQHLLLASCIPLSRLELIVDDLIPHRATRIILVDDMATADGLATRAARRLAQLGYHHAVVLAGGVEGWREAGFELFSGINVPSKAFGEFVEQHYATPHLTATQLHEKIAAGEDLIILDSRPLDEYRRMNIPGGIDCPGAELVYRVHDQAPDPKTLVVVNCAGRTRSIIGAQSLINAGIANRVVALENGTMGWQLAGLQLEHEQTRQAPAPSARGLVMAKDCAARIAERFGVEAIDRTTLAAWYQQNPARTLYLLDVRSPAEYERAHLPGSRNAPGGQLVQATDEYMAVRNARVVLIDDAGVRATVTASWLIQMGWPEVYVLSDGLTEEALESGPHRPRVLGLQTAQTLSPAQLQDLLTHTEPIALIDLATSLEYRKQHIPGAWWGVRSRLPATLARLADCRILVLTATDERLAHLTARDLKESSTDFTVHVLQGGNQAWVDAGFGITSGMEKPLTEPDDVWYKPYENVTAIEQAMRDYLTWEVNLVKQLEHDADIQFLSFN